MNCLMYLFLYLCVAGILVKLSGAIGSLFSEYEKVSSIIIRYENASFNAVYRIIFPVVSVFVISNLCALLNINLIYNFIIVIFFWLLRVLYICLMQRVILANKIYFITTAFFSIVLSVVVYTVSQKDGEFFLPDKGDLISQFWIIVALFVYKTFDKIQEQNGNINKRRKKLELYVNNQLKEFTQKFKDVILSVTTDKDIIKVILSVMIVENFNRPITLRYFENIFPSLFKTKGIMQVKYSGKISDAESVRLGSELILRYYSDMFREYNHFDDWMVDDIAKKYNGGDTYPTMVREVYEIVYRSEF